MHLLIILNLLIFALIGLWVLRRLWAISSAERRERRQVRREQRTWQLAQEARWRELRAAEAAEARRLRRASRRKWELGDVVGFAVPFLATLGVLFGRALILGSH